MTETGAWHRTLCPYCGVGCGLLVKVTEGVVSRVKGDPEHPANFGDVCAKAIHLPPVLRTEDRLLYPQLRPHRGAELARVSWQAALGATAARTPSVLETFAWTQAVRRAGGSGTTQRLQFSAAFLAEGT